MKAAETLGRNLACGDEPAEIRAAAVILTQMKGLRESVALEERLAALEQAFAKGRP